MVYKISEFKIDHAVFEGRLNSTAYAGQLEGWKVINVSSPFQSYDCSGIPWIEKSVDIVYSRPIEHPTGVMLAGEENAKTD